MASLNRVMLIGNLGRDPEVRVMQNGTHVCNLSVATTETWKKDGERKEKTEWHRVVIFGPLAENAGKYLHKGSKVYLSGQLQTRKWKDKDDVEHYATEVVLQGFNAELQFLDAKPQANGAERPAAKPRAQSADDDIPW